MANEKRLIDFEMARKSVMEILAGKVSTVTATKVSLAMQEAAVAAVEVVRCRECKHWKFIDGLNPHWECQNFYGLHECGYLTGADDFCSYGEKMDLPHFTEKTMAAIEAIGRIAHGEE